MVEVKNQHAGFSICGIKWRIRYGLASIVMFGLISMAGLSQGISNMASAVSISSILTRQGSATGGDEIIIKGDGFMQSTDINDSVSDTVSMVAPNGKITIVILTAGGRVFTYGDNTIGQIGNDSECGYNQSNGETYTTSCYYNKPVNITRSFGDNKITNIAVYGNAFLATSQSGDIYIWGYNQLDNEVISSPIDVTNIPSIANNQKLILSIQQTLAMVNNDNIAYLSDDDPATIYINTDQIDNDSSLPDKISLPLDTITTQSPTIKQISFGGTLTNQFVVVDDNTIKVTTPAHTAGRVDVELISNDDSDSVSLPQGFEYI